MADTYEKNREERKTFAVSTKEEAIKWLNENVNDLTRGVFVATNERFEWWAHSPHVYDQSALASLRSVVSGGLDGMAARVVEWIEFLRRENR